MVQSLCQYYWRSGSGTLRIIQSVNEIRIIGTRHGEKLYETLRTKEEYIKAEDLGGFFRVPADKRD
jgi:UDP-glucose 4-epimerase